MKGNTKSSKTNKGYLNRIFFIRSSRSRGIHFLNNLRNFSKIQASHSRMNSNTLIIVDDLNDIKKREVSEDE